MEVTHGGNIFEMARLYGWDWHDILDCSASINPLGPAPGTVPAIQNAMNRIVHYPEREPARLRHSLAAAWQVNEDQIMLGNGATELIFFVARVLVGLPATLALPVFLEFHRAFPQARTVSLNDAASWPPAGLLVLTRPANPTGQSLCLEIIQGRLESSDHPLLVDESFLEFSELRSAAALLERYPHLIVLRSLTKFYALPGLRIGALVSSAENIRCWSQQREPWQVNVLAEEAALAAIADTAHAQQSKEFVRTERAWLFEQLVGIAGAQPQESDANFLCVRVDSSAAALTRHLLTHKILIRNCVGWPGVAGEVVRVAVRRRVENERLLKAWREFGCD
jgi:threonine-phosphate decarboxylase